jgi:hypothetical protein
MENTIAEVKNLPLKFKKKFNQAKGTMNWT